MFEYIIFSKKLTIKQLWDIMKDAVFEYFQIVRLL